MRWPFGPPHLTLKPSKKKKKTKQKQKKTKKTKKKKTKKHKNTKKELFSYQSIFFFFGGCPKFPFLTTWPKKRAPKKHYKNRGFSKAFFWKQLCVTKRPFLDQKTQNQKFQLSFFFAFSSLSTTKTTKIGWNPYFYSVLANLKKENFQNLNIKHRNLKNPIFAPFFWKRLFLENWQIIGHKKKHTKW